MLAMAMLIMSTVDAASKLVTQSAGLSMDFYVDSCPQVLTIVREKVSALIHRDPAEAAGLIRILFHDCFVQGCDASLLLEEPTTEQTATPNVDSIRVSSLQAVDAIKDVLEEACPGVVSCADTIALSAAMALNLVGGPMMRMPTGRRDSMSAASNQTVIDNIPATTLSISQLKQNFQEHGLDVHDLVALSGAHTIGQAHCRTIDLQPVSADLDPRFAAVLSEICLLGRDNSDVVAAVTVPLDSITRTLFDNTYFHHVLTRTAIFHTDAALLNASDTARLVHMYAMSQPAFFHQFAQSMMKMSQIGVLTGDQGVIRTKCTLPS